MPPKYINLEHHSMITQDTSYTPNPPSKMKIMEKYGITPWLRLVYAINFEKRFKDVLT